MRCVRYQRRSTAHKSQQTMDLSHLSGSDRVQMQAYLEQKQVKDFLSLYSGLVDRCFRSCAKEFNTKVLTEKENTCVDRCVEKFMKHSERVGLRFAEQNAVLQEKAANGEM